MHIILNNSSMIPIYEQLMDQVKNEIIAGNLKENEPLPSVRTLSGELKISALTVKKAYDKLEEEADGEQADESDEAFSAGALWPVLLTIVVLVLAGFGIQYVEITLALCLVCYVLRYYRTTAFACAVLCVRRVLDVILLVMQSGSWLEIALDVISAAAFLALTYAAMRTYIVHRHEDEDKAEE